MASTRLETPQPLRIIFGYGEYPAAINALEKAKLIVPSGQSEILKLALDRQIASKLR